MFSVAGQAGSLGIPGSAMVTGLPLVPQDKILNRQRYFANNFPGQGDPPNTTSNPFAPTLSTVEATYVLKDHIEFRRNIRQNQLLFMQMTTDPLKRANLVNIFDVNAILRKGYQQALLFMSSTRDVSNVISQEDLASVKDTTERHIDKHAVIRAIDPRTDLDCMRTYLSARGIACMWQVVGPNIADHNIHQNYGSEASGATVCTTGVRGDLEIEDIWGHEAAPNTVVTLILKRTQECDGTWGPFAFHPYVWSGPFIPRDELQYTDLAGITQYGIVYVIGKVRESSEKYTSGEVRRLVVGAGSPDRTYANASNELFSKVQRLQIHRFTPQGRPFNVILPEL